MAIAAGRTAGDRSIIAIAVAGGALVATSLVLLQGAQVVLPAIAVAAAMLALFNRKVALYLILPAMALSPDISIGGLPVRVEDLLMVPLAIGWLAHLCVTHERQGTPLDRLLIAYALVAFAATAWGMHLGTVHLFSVSKYVSSSFQVLKRVEFVLLFLIVADTVRTTRDVRTMSYVLIGSAVALSIYAAQQYANNGAIALGPEGAPIHEPGFASMLTVALALGMMRGATTGGKLLLAAVVLFGIATLPLSLGRNYIAATALILLYVGWKEQRWIFAVVPILVVLAFLVYPSGITQRISTLQNVLSTNTKLGNTAVAPTSVFFRAEAPLYYAKLALGHSPVLGYGMGVVPLGAVDSEYMIQLAYTGLAGLIIFLIMGVHLFRLTKAARLAANTPFDGGLAFGFQLVIAGYAIYSLFAASVSATHTGGPFFVVAALAGALLRSSVAERAEQGARGAAGTIVRAVAGGEARLAVSARFAARRQLWLAHPLTERSSGR